MHFCYLSSDQTRRFSEPAFRPSGTTNHWKTQWIATFLPCRAPASSVFWLLLFFDLISSSLLFSDSSHLCFSIYIHIVGRLTSKLPSTNLANLCQTITNSSLFPWRTASYHAGLRRATMLDSTSQLWLSHLWGVKGRQPDHVLIIKQLHSTAFTDRNSLYNSEDSQVKPKSHQNVDFSFFPSQSAWQKYESYMEISIFTICAGGGNFLLSL